MVIVAQKLPSNNLSNYNFNLGDTTIDNHEMIDRIATFSGGSWINKNYNANFGGQWCFIDSFKINDSGYAMQRITAANGKTILATRYCNNGVWGDWDIGVTKSDLSDYYKKTDGKMFNGRTSMTVPPNSTKSLTSPEGSFFIAKSTGNNYAGCVYFVVTSWSGIRKTYPILEDDKVTVTFKNVNNGSANKISATVTTGAIGDEIPFDIYALG